MVAALTVIGVTVFIVAFVFLSVVVVGHEYDRHPWVKRWLDAQARVFVPPQRDDNPVDSLPKEYTDQIPGGWDQP